MKYHMYNIPILVHQHLHDTVDGCEILHQLVDGKHQIITPWDLQSLTGIPIVSNWCRMACPCPSAVYPVPCSIC